MNTIYIGQQKVIVHGGRHFRLTDKARNAVVQSEWAESILARPAVLYPNGRHSHEVANEVIEKAEDDLIDDMVLIFGA